MNGRVLIRQRNRHVANAAAHGAETDSKLVARRRSRRSRRTAGCTPAAGRNRRVGRVDIAEVRRTQIAVRDLMSGITPHLTKMAYRFSAFKDPNPCPLTVIDRGRSAQAFPNFIALREGRGVQGRTLDRPQIAFELLGARGPQNNRVDAVTREYPVERQLDQAAPVPLGNGFQLFHCAETTLMPVAVLIYRIAVEARPFDRPFVGAVFTRQPRISDLAPLTARVYTLTRRSATISPPERGGG